MTNFTLSSSLSYSYWQNSSIVSLVDNPALKPVYTKRVFLCPRKYSSKNKTANSPKETIKLGKTMYLNLRFYFSVLQHDFFFFFFFFFNFILFLNFT